MAKKNTSTTTKKAVAKEPVKKGTTKKPVSKKAAVAKSPAKKATATKKISQSAKSPVTQIVARVDVGYGNELFIRGEGAGLSWDKGVPMQCVGANEWLFSTEAAKTGIVFKFLINDSHWSDGEDVTVPVGGTSITAPSFT